MNKLLSVIFLLSGFSSLYSQSGQWTWMHGDTTTSYSFPVYGTRGVAADSNWPGARNNPAQWTDAGGNLYLYGGGSYDRKAAAVGKNDFWKYDVSTRQWTWLGGDTITKTSAIYGVKGVASSANKPGSRGGEACWTDTAGNLWIFGGSGYTTSGTSGYLCDLWKYTISTGQWTWVSGDSTLNANAVYETKGIPSATARPGGRQSPASWKDAAGNFWLYGGFGYGTTRTSTDNNDLWMFDPVQGQWTWVNGENAILGYATYGTKGVASAANKPAGKSGATAWTDLSGNVWLFGGFGRSYSARFFEGYFNDLWQYNPATGIWTWMNGDTAVNQPSSYGVPGRLSPGNSPQARRYAQSWTDSQGNCWLLGGYGYAKNKVGLLNDLWKLVPSTGQWTWMGGDSITYAAGVYTTAGVADAGTKPRARSGAVQWTDTSGHLWLFGGTSNLSDETAALDDLCSYSIADGRWTWVSGNKVNQNSGIYGTKGVADAANWPGIRYRGLNWTDATGNLWLFGGIGYAPSGLGYLSDLWKYTPSTGRWTWISGDNAINQAPVYGKKGVPSAGNNPGGRHMSVKWTDAEGNFWIFGGRTLVDLTEAATNDLWKFSPATGMWTWMSGDSVQEAKAVFGVKGVSAPANKPGSRQTATGWKDTAGNLWLFGGLGYGSSYDVYGSLNDVWKYVPSSGQWTWMGGADVADANAVYGIQGNSDPANTPGGRSMAASWTDLSGSFWLFAGGAGNDLWKFNPLNAQWTWVGGGTGKISYGTRGVPAASNIPGARGNAVSVTDTDGNLWLMGGSGTAENGSGYLNDLWKYVPSTGLWTWVSGDKTINQASVFGTKGVPSSDARPGGRMEAMGWADRSGKLWLLNGGIINLSTYKWQIMNDFWQYSILTPLPVKLTSFTARKQEQTALLNWTTAQEQGNFAFVIQRSSNGTSFDSIGIKAAAGSNSTAASYSFTDSTPLAGTNFYRLKQVDVDGKYQYSVVQTVVMDEALAGFVILRNPVRNFLNVRLQLPETQKLTFEVRDLNGHLLLRQETEGKKGSSQYAFPVQQLAGGSYLINVRSGTASSTKTFVKE